VTLSVAYEKSEVSLNSKSDPLNY